MLVVIDWSDSISMTGDPVDVVIDLTIMTMIGLAAAAAVRWSLELVQMGEKGRGVALHWNGRPADRMKEEKFVLNSPFVLD